MGQARIRVNARKCLLLLCASSFALPAMRAEVCDPKAFQGAYGLFMNGAATIGSATRPIVVVGRLTLNDSGNLTGISSASFTGLILGNGVTGKYEAHDDCSVAWTLQDTSGSFQHFAGTMSADGRRVAFRQTDPGGPEGGTLRRTMDGCSASSLAGTFSATASGTTIDVNTAIDSGSVSFRGVVIADGAHNLLFVPGPDDQAVLAGSYDVQPDCFVGLVLELPAGGNKTTKMHFRAIVVDNGREVLAMQTDPGTAVEFRLIAK